MTTRNQKYLITKKSKIVLSRSNSAVIAVWEFSHKLYIKNISGNVVWCSRARKTCRLIRVAWKFEVHFGDIFVHFLYNIRFSFIKFNKGFLYFTSKMSKMFPKLRSNFHAARINGRFFGSSGLLTFTRDKYFIYSPHKNCQTCTGEPFRALFRSWDFLLSNISGTV